MNSESPKSATARSSSQLMRFTSHMRIFISPFPPPTMLRADAKSINGPEIFGATPESGAMTSPPYVTHFTTTSAVQ
jgi:hypothetical protein